MKTLTIRTFIIIFANLICLNFAGAADASLKLRTDEGGQLVDLSSQTKVDIKGDFDNEVNISAPAMLRLEGRIPVLFIPVQEGSSEVKINPPSFKEAAADVGQKEISFLVSDVMVGIQHVQKEIQRKNYDQALSKIEDMQKSYPNVAFLDFIRGSVLLLKGKKSEARRAVKRALETHPNFQEGKDFLKALGGSDEGGARE